VHDDVAEIDQDPPPAVIALDAERLLSGSLRLFNDPVRDALRLPLAARAADDEQVRDGGYLGDVEHQDVLGLLVTGGFDDKIGERSWRELSARGCRHRW
jgi:hypothetical protein